MSEKLIDFKNWKKNEDQLFLTDAECLNLLIQLNQLFGSGTIDTVGIRRVAGITLDIEYSAKKKPGKWHYIYANDEVYFDNEQDYILAKLTLL